MIASHVETASVARGPSSMDRTADPHHVDRRPPADQTQQAYHEARGEAGDDSGRAAPSERLIQLSGRALRRLNENAREGVDGAARRPMESGGNDPRAEA